MESLSNSENFASATIHRDPSINFGNLVIGQDIRLDEVVEGMLQSTSLAVLLQKWKRFARNLEITDIQVTELERFYNSDSYDLIYNILRIWRAINGKNARMNVLIEALVKCEVKDVSDTLEAEFIQTALTAVKSRNIQSFFKKGLPKITTDETISSDPNANEIQRTDQSVTTSPNDTVESLNDKAETIHESVDQLVWNHHHKPDIKDTSLGPKPKIKISYLRRHKTTLFITIGVVLLILLFAVPTLIVVYIPNSTKYHNDVKNDSFLQQGTTMEKLPLYVTLSAENISASVTTPITNPQFQNSKEPEIIIQVGSSYDLESKKTFLETKTSIWLELNINNLPNWEKGFTIPHPQKVGKLIIRGILLPGIVLEILNQTKHLKLLHFINDKKKLIEIMEEDKLNFQTTLSNKVSLHSLRGLIIEGFETSEIFYVMSGKIKMDSLKALTIQNSSINPRNHPYIRELFENISNSLTRLFIKNTSISLENNKSLFDSVTSFKYLKHLHLDFIHSENDTAAVFFGPTCVVFSPNLEILSSDAGTLPWNQLKEVFTCKSVGILNLTVEVSPHKSHFNISFLKHFPNLCRAQIKLYNANCKHDTIHSGYLKLVGFESLPKTIESVEFLSNCKFEQVNAGKEWQTAYLNGNEWNALKLFPANTVNR